MFGTIRKHQTWLWAVIITLTIISFVYFFSPYQKMTNGPGSVNYGSINGERVNREDFIKARGEVYLSYFFSRGSWPEENKTPGFEPVRETYFRLLLVQKQKEYGIHISDDVVAQVARDMLRPFQKTGTAAAEVFVQQILKPNGFQVSDYERFVRHQLGIQELAAAVGLGGRLVTQQEAKGLYVREHEELATQVVFFPATNQLAGLTITPEAVSMFFTNQLALYRIPEHIQVDYVKFDLTNHLAEATDLLAKMTNLDLQIEEAYRENPTNLLSQFKAASLEEAKVKIREARLKDFESQLARRKAAEFAYALEEKEQQGPDTLALVAKEKNLTVQVSEPFDRFDPPKSLAVSAAFASAAFSLTNGRFAGPLVGDEAVYIIGLNRRIPSEVPPFEQVRARVENDYKMNLATALARQAGADFNQAATNQLAQGKTFDEICTGAKVTPVELPPFSLSTQSLPGYEEGGLLNQFKQAAFGTNPGKVSTFFPTDEGGFVLFVKAKVPMNEEKMQKELPAFVNYVRGSRQNEAFQAWFRKEVERAGLPNVPLLRQPQQPGASTAKS
jgi:parvulin-like peptidyl-prolyl isomerase